MKYVVGRVVAIWKDVAVVVVVAARSSAALQAETVIACGVGSFVAAA